MVTPKMSWCLSFFLHITLLLSLFSVTTKTGQAKLEKVLFVSLDTVEPTTNIALPQKPVLKRKMAPNSPKETGSIFQGQIPDSRLPHAGMTPDIEQTPEPVAAKEITSVFQPEKEVLVVSSIEEKGVAGFSVQNRDETAPFSVNLDTNSPFLSAPALSGINLSNLSSYCVSLRRQILKKVTYPEIARRRGQEGAVKVAFILDQQGNLKEKRVADSSGFEVLDSAALQSLTKATPFLSFPSGVKVQKFSFSLTIRYQLQ
ncbi:MAG: energy transducer TonB [Candidatus Omnitrophota bacterium]|nr:energy transducer TonB [Candidatus Omnitrophota bacterium]